MGTWGTGIFADDVAADLRDDYREHLGDGLSASDATDRVLFDWAEELADPETANVVWLALAATQVRVGRIEDRVRERALAIIDGGSDLERWADEPRLAAARGRVLEKLRAELTGPQRAPSRIPRPVRSVWPFEPGSIVAFRRASDGYLLCRVVGAFGEHGIRGGRIGIVEVLDWTGDVIPAPATAEGLDRRPPTDWTADAPMPLGITVLNQRQLDRWSLVVPGAGSGGFTRNNLINTNDVDRVAGSRYGFAPSLEGRR